MSYRAIDTGILDTVSVDNDTFQVFVTKFNQVIDHLRNTVVTVSNTGAYNGNNTGNGYVTGIFGGNVIVATTELRGGNISTSNTLTINSALSIPNTVSITQNLTVTTGTSNLFSANIRGATDIANTLNVNRAATFANTMTITGNTTVNNYIIHKTDYIHHAVSNGDIGTSATVSLFTFPKADYTSGRILLQSKNGVNVSVSEALFLHDGTNDPIVTIYARLDAPAASNNGVLVVDANTTHIRIRYTQSANNTATKLHLQLTK